MNNLTKNNLDKVEDKNPQGSNPRFDLKYFPQTDILANSMHKMFPEQSHENNTVLKAKEILGDKYTIEEVKSMLASYEYLINGWLEEYEKKILNKKTLKELLRDL
ncbi:MAG: hypothetical protein US54_C0010G0021 [Candidatus Roizmanbacteria bacterium GW2011_GWA2_37_7]|uniref:Uncharacterized protein n=1 Tax=Candidatus Roizmanbacteria bacterium GW2011_GWA2_37_7 TaxID=1618481 RepID=A0A0G0HIN6_9BACT|nr:MAG: hypothetical protein US54_C0010G0021 [Candidatus Roizmanbacteria bacterium GW2011_GWA2_37_7]